LSDNKNGRVSIFVVQQIVSYDPKFVFRVNRPLLDTSKGFFLHGPPLVPRCRTSRRMVRPIR
jgi:hypothetical protein